MRILFFLILSLHSVLGQDNSDIDSLMITIDEATFTVDNAGIKRYGTPRDIVPSEFIGGTAHMLKYIYAKMDLVEDSLQSRVYVNFTIDKCGKTYDIEIVKNLPGPSIRAQAEKIIAELNFHPGYNVANNSYRESQMVIPLDFNNDSIRKYENYLVTEPDELSKNYADTFYTNSLSDNERDMYQKTLEIALSIPNNWFVIRQILDNRLPPQVFLDKGNVGIIEYDHEINALYLSEINFSNLTTQFFYIFQDYLNSTEETIKNKSQGYANLIFESKLYHDLIVYFYSPYRKNLDSSILEGNDDYINWLDKITDNKRVIFDINYKEEFKKDYFIQREKFVHTKKNLTVEMIDKGIRPTAFYLAIQNSTEM